MDLTKRIRGKVVEHATTNGTELRLRMADGSEINIAWVNDNGEAIKGKPVVVQHGARLIARGMQDLIHVPQH